MTERIKPSNPRWMIYANTHRAKVRTPLSSE